MPTTQPRTNNDIVALIKAAKISGKLPANYRYGRTFKPTTRFQINNGGRTRIVVLREFIDFLTS